MVNGSRPVAAADVANAVLLLLYPLIAINLSLPAMVLAWRRDGPDPDPTGMP